LTSKEAIVRQKNLTLLDKCAALEAENLEFRRMLWMAHTHGRGYGDDGALQDTTRRPFIDWKRDTIEQIHEALRQRALSDPRVQRAIEESSGYIDFNFGEDPDASK
jgi:hypothetical protein